MPTITTRDGTGLFVRRWGEGPPILFTAAFAMTSEAWRSVMTLAAQSGRQAIEMADIAAFMREPAMAAAE